MPTPRELIAQLEPERFHEILSASPKKFREEVFRRAGIRAKTAAFSLKSEPKNEVRTHKLLTAIREGMELGDGVAEELIRNYLYTRRPMLAEALDHFKVPHDNGLTDEDLSFVEQLNPQEGKVLKRTLSEKYGEHDVDLYFAFMNIPSA